MNKFVFLFVIAFCGTLTSSFNVDNRILGGTAASDPNHRYMVSVQQKSQLSSYTRGHRCGGALVTLKHAVTSASCLHTNGALISAADYRVFAGAVALTNDGSAERHRDIESFTINPSYSAGTPYVNDIAIITLASEFPSSAVAILPLSAIDATSALVQGCTSSGWGSQNDSSTASTQLMVLQKTVIEQPACQPFYTAEGSGGNTAITVQNNTMICALALAQTSSCVGDSGNPLVCNGQLTGVLVINGNDCSGAVGNIARPEVYTRVSNYREWINNTSGASIFQPGMALLAVIAIVQIVTSKV